MSIANNEAQSSGDAPPFRQGALDAAAIRRECPQFRVLIIGKANAGKTTILRKICNAKPDEKPVIYDPKGKKVGQGFSLFKVLQRKAANSADVLNPSIERGEHNIEYQLTYPGSNFIFHDSRGIEAGSENEIEVVKEFIQKRERCDDLKDQLHVIWYCVPMDDQRPISGAEKTFFSLGTGRVPVVLIFTKFDALEDKCYSKLRDQGKSHQEAKNGVPGLANKIFRNEYLSRIENTEFPPKTYVCLAEMNKQENQCSDLSEKTMNILDNNVLVNLFVSTQMNNLDLCIKRGIQLIWSNDWLHVIFYGLFQIFPNYWKPDKYKPNNAKVAWAWAADAAIDAWAADAAIDALAAIDAGTHIWATFSQQFPSLFPKEMINKCHGLFKFQIIAVVALVAEHSFWFSGSDIKTQVSNAIKSFKSQKHDISVIMAEVETVFNNASSTKEDSAWLTQWVIDNKLKHK